MCAECPRAPVLNAEHCVVSNDRAHIGVQYSEAVRVRSLHLYYKEATALHGSSGGGSSEKDWDCVDVTDMSHGSAHVTLTSLRHGTMYKAYAVASNDIGDSLPSDELQFRTVGCEHVEVLVVTK